MPATLLFITGVLAGVVVGFIHSRIVDRFRSAGKTGDLGLLRVRLGQANEERGKFSLQLEAQNAEIKQQQLQLLEAKEAAAISHNQYEAITAERDGFKSSEANAESALEKARIQKEDLSLKAAEAT